MNKIKQHAKVRWLVNPEIIGYFDHYYNDERAIIIVSENNTVVEYNVAIKDLEVIKK